MVVEYTDCIYTERWDHNLNNCPGYDIKTFDGEVQFQELWGMWNTPSLQIQELLTTKGFIASNQGYQFLFWEIDI